VLYDPILQTTSRLVFYPNHGSIRILGEISSDVVDGVVVLIEDGGVYGGRGWGGVNRIVSLHK